MTPTATVTARPTTRPELAASIGAKARALNAKLREEAAAHKAKGEPTAEEKRAREVALHIRRGGFGGYEPQITQLAELILGTKLPEPTTEEAGIRFYPGMVVVPTVDDVGHGATLGRPYMIWDGRRALSPHDGRVMGGFSNERSSFGEVTEEQVEEALGVLEHLSTAELQLLNERVG